MKKRFISLLSLFIILISLSACSSKDRLLLLNWGEYISADLVKEFEKENNCTVVVSLADSNDIFYSKVKSGTTVYDLVIPSDYMVLKMYKKDLLQKIDYHKLGFETEEAYLDTFLPSVKGIIKEMEKTTSGIKDYFVPYFYGTWGLMYNKNKEGIEDAIKNATNPWSLLFDDEALPKGSKVGMYDTSRYSYAASMFYLNESPNSQSPEALNLMKDVFKKKKFTAWGTDTLKKDIAHNNLDLAFMWTGDFLDMLYLNLKTKTLDEIDFDIVISEKTIAFCDSFVITKNARNVDLAHKFIKFFLEKSHAYENAKIVGYCTPNLKAYDEITRFKDNLKDLDNYLALKKENKILTSYLYKNHHNYLLVGTYLKDSKTVDYLLEITGNDLEKVSDLTLINEDLKLDVNFLNGWAYAVNKYYPKYIDNEKGFLGEVLTDLDREYVDKINTILNNAKVK